MRGTLEQAQAMGIPWREFLAPITTFNADFTADEVTAWIVILDDPEPVPARLVFEKPTTSSPATVNFAEPHFPIDELVGGLSRYVGWMQTIEADRVTSPKIKAIATGFLRDLM